MQNSGTGSSAEQKVLKQLFQSSSALLCLSAILFASGVHTVALQGYAWVRMFDAYSHEVPLSTALDLTFSGEELCGICVISQDTLKNVSDSLELTLGEQKPLVQASFAIVCRRSETGIFPEDGFSPLQPLIEICLALDPPPPRAT